MLKIGNYKIENIRTSTFWLDGGAMFGVVPRTLWSRHHPPDEKGRIHMTMNALLIRDETRNILVDTGVGTKWNEKMMGIYAIEHEPDNLISSLERVGLKPEDITDVILTHLHFDHVGGATHIADGQAIPTFPNATHHVQRRQWDWAHAPSLKDQASFFPENYDPLQAAGLLNLLDGAVELFPGIDLVEIHGHTVAQQLVKISDGDTTLLHCADLIPLHSQISVPWVMAYDLYPLTTIAEKQDYLAQAVEEKWRLFFEHDPVVMAATIAQGKRGYEIVEKFDSI